MRPPKFWEGVDEEVKTQKKHDDKDKDKEDKGKDKGKPASRIDASSSPAGLRRTLSAAVNQDAQRIAAMRGKPSSSLKQSHRPEPKTSPVRHTPARAVRNAKWTNATSNAGAASSPGGWVKPMHPPPPPSDNFHPVSHSHGISSDAPSSPPKRQRTGKGNVHIPHDSPNTAIKRILGTTETSMPSLDLPLSDDAENALSHAQSLSLSQATSSFDWTTDLSAFFDVEGLALNAETTEGERGAGGAMLDRSDGTENEDDVLSQLFHRTSSAILESSPTPFDFSQLPPSSPPIMPSDLPHSALLLSSPDLSPMDRKYSPHVRGDFNTPASVASGMTPLASESGPTPVPSQQHQHQHVNTNTNTNTNTGGTGGNGAREKGAKNAHEVAPDDLKSFLANHHFDQSALEDLLRISGEGEGSEQGVSDDLFAMFEAA